MTLGDSVTNGALISAFLAVLYALIRFAEHALALRAANGKAKRESAAPANPGTTGTIEACAVCRSEVADTHDRVVETHFAVISLTEAQKKQIEVLEQIRDRLPTTGG